MKKSKKKSNIKYKHSDIFYAEKYLQYKKKVMEYGGSSQFKDRNEFISTYNTMREDKEKRIIDKLAYASVYGTDYKTALAQYRLLKKLDPKATVRLKELKIMDSEAFAIKYSNELKDAYRSYKNQGNSAKEASALLSQYWFGSN